MVDAVNNDSVVLAELKEQELPKEMRSMDEQERRDYIDKQTKTRAQLLEQIKQLDVQRRRYIAEEMQNRSDKGDDTLEAVVIKTVREQIVNKNFSVGSSL